MSEIISEIKFAIEGDGAIAATEELLAIDGIEGSYDVSGLRQELWLLLNKSASGIRNINKVSQARGSPRF